MALKLDTTINVSTMVTLGVIGVGALIGYVRTVDKVEVNSTQIGANSLLHVTDISDLALDLDGLRNAQTLQAISFGKTEANIENIIRLLQSRDKAGESYD